jgi:hypothetical protein
MEKAAADQKQNENTTRKRGQLSGSRRFNARAGERLLKPASALPKPMSALRQTTRPKPQQRQTAPRQDTAARTTERVPEGSE